jgi:uncharacterized Zn-finger protein
VGDHFEIIADVEATEAAAPALAASVVSWLTRKGIITHELAAGRVLGACRGYPPGLRYTAAVTEPDEHMLRLQANGVEVSSGRAVFSPAQGAVGSVVCPLCGQTVDLNDPATGQVRPDWQLFSDAFGAWMEGGPGELRCPQCSRVARLNDWSWTYEPFVVGFLGVTFWNWPPLSESFIAQLAGHLEHRVAIVRGKL